MVYEIMVPIQRFDRRHFPSSEHIYGKVVKYFLASIFYEMFSTQISIIDHCYTTNGCQVFDLNYFKLFYLIIRTNPVLEVFFFNRL